MTQKTINKFDFQELARRWSPPIVVRSQAQLDKFSGGLLNARTLANEDSQGTGPDQRIRVGRKIAYPVDSLIRWIEQKSDIYESGRTK